MKMQLVSNLAFCPWQSWKECINHRPDLDKTISGEQ
jgi:hypothetical protein